MFSHIFRFELAFHARQPLVYVVSLVMFLLSFGGTVSDNISIGGTIGNININSPFNVIIVLAAVSFIASLIAGVVYASSPVLRDFDQKVAELFLTTRVTKFDYLMGRFCGALCFCFIVFFAAVLGIFLGEFMPWLDPERMGPLRLDAYWFAIWVIAVPNILFIATLVFLIATLTRSVVASFVVLIVVLAVSGVISTLVDPENIQLLSFLDPFGQVALTELTRYWTPFEMNELVIPLEGALLVNRIYVMVLSLIFCFAAYYFFPFSLEFAGKRRNWFSWIKRKKKSSAVIGQPTVASSTAPSIQKQSFDLGCNLRQFASLLRIEIHNIVIGKAFIMMALIGMLQVMVSAFIGLASIFGTEVYPTTSALLLIINGSYSLPLIVVIIFYSSELIVREKTVGVAEMIDSMPHPNWVVIAAKLLGLMLVIALMLLAVMFGAMLVQLIKGYYDFNISEYLFGLFSFFQFPIWIACVLAMFAQVLTGNRYLGMFVVVVYFVGMLFLPQQGFDHNLYLFSTPQISYSVFTGWGPNLGAFVWFSVYWSLFCVLLLIAMQLLWIRGVETKGRFRWRNLSSRLTPVVTGSAVLALFGFIASGSFIYYNTNILNQKLSSLDVEEASANYEKAYKQYEDLELPDVVALYTEVDIFPQRQEARIHGRYTLENNQATTISELHFTIPPALTIEELDIPNSRQTHSDADLGYYIYQLDSPMRPGATLDVSFTVDWLTPGFVNNSPNTRLLSSGTFFNNFETFPLPGYQKGSELVDNNRRRRYDLPPAERMAKIDDESQWDVGLGTRTRAT